ncbi:MAG: gephyrin-like molybdotransferase Glp [Candidatus Omnitrophota bacterium]
MSLSSRRLISVKAAQDIIARHTAFRKVCRINLQEAFNRVLAQDIFANQDSPHFDKSFMDGYALNAKDIRRIPETLRISAQIRAGQIPRGPLRKGTCAQIATGAMLPKASDAVVIKEKARLVSEGIVAILHRPSSGDHIYRRGEFFKKGKRILGQGAVINSAAIALLASQGISKVLVFGAPRVALLSTGDEIADLGSRKKTAGVWNATAPMLEALLRAMGVRPRYLGLVLDQPGRMHKKITQGLKYDILIITGAVSAGDFDFVPAVLKKAGVKVLFHKVAIRPGKPLLFGKCGRHLVFGLPGNPVSSWLDFFLFIKPVIQKMIGLDAGVAFEQGVLGKTITHDPDRLSFWPARVSFRGSTFKVDPLRYAGSADLGALARANALALLTRHRRKFAKNSKIKFMRITQ